MSADSNHTARPLPEARVTFVRAFGAPDPCLPPGAMSADSIHR